MAYRALNTDDAKQSWNYTRMLALMICLLKIQNPLAHFARSLCSLCANRLPCIIKLLHMPLLRARSLLAQLCISGIIPLHLSPIPLSPSLSYYHLRHLTSRYDSQHYSSSSDHHPHSPSCSLSYCYFDCSPSTWTQHDYVASSHRRLSSLLSCQ